MICYKDYTFSLNWIDVSGITDMTSMFSDYTTDRKMNFMGDISEWDVSNVKKMTYMFKKSVFSGDISKWDVSNVVDMN